MDKFVMHKAFTPVIFAVMAVLTFATCYGATRSLWLSVIPSGAVLGVGYWISRTPPNSNRN